MLLARRLGRRLVDGAVTVTVSERRSQLRNREVAMRRLAELVSAGLAPGAPPHEQHEGGPPRRRPAVSARSFRHFTVRVQFPSACTEITDGPALSGTVPE